MQREPRFLYNLKGIGRAVLPRIFTQSMLEGKLKKLLRIYAHKDDTLCQRLNHYNKLSAPFRLPATQDDMPEQTQCQEPLPPPPSRLAHLAYLTPNLATLKENTHKAGSVYYYDSYEWTRYFPDSFMWAYLFYDVNQLVGAPAIVKSRPIVQYNTNSVILQLEKYRHFHFIRDSIPFEQKKDILFFRGAIYQDHRIRFFEQHFNNPNCDIGHVGRADVPAEWIKPKVSIRDHLPYKFLLSLEGYDVASNLKWVLSSNSLCVMSAPEIETWFMEEKLQAGVHYAAINRDYSDLDAVLEYYKIHTNEAKEIIHNANQFCAQFYDRAFEGLLNLLVLRKYFYLSGQLDVSAEERVLFGL